jgi:branched-chain amino acid transport system ATP-binding protein
MSATLEVTGVSVHFGGVTAVDDAHITADAGAVTGLIGPNGAGKTTLFNVITGVQPPSTGTVSLNGTDVSRLPTYRRARLGMARTFQRLELFWTLSVLDNVLVAAEQAGDPNPADTARAVLERVGVAHLADEQAGSLPTGSARLVEVARALACEPKVLLLDEPASGLDETETRQLGVLLRRLAAEGLAVLLVEHDMSRVIASGTPAEVRIHPLVIEAYLGAA